MALALAASVVATRIVLLRHLSQETDSELTHELQEIGLNRPGAAPVSQRPSVSIDASVRAALSRATPAQSQQLLAISDGKVLTRIPARSTPALASDHRLIRQWAAVRRATFGTVQTSAGMVRYLAAPIPVTRGMPVGSDIFVAATFIDRERASVNTTIGIAATVGFVALIAAIIGAWLIAGRILAPLRELEVAARSVTESDLSHRLEVKGNDELGRLAADFNAMLDRVESAFRAQRQFIDDAGHELRTPLTVIRGHLELLGDNPAELEEVRTVVTDELDRMGRMVNDLLVLARAERPDFLRLASVNLATLTAEVEDKATSLADRLWLDGGRADVEVLADRQRLTQAWMQLAQNATQHTEPGDRIELGSRVDRRLGGALGGGRRDPACQRICGPRSSRASPVPAVIGRTGEHFGLGLPIVRAIAEAHHGQVSVGRSELGGALFTMRFPLSDSDDEGRR